MHAFSQGSLCNTLWSKHGKQPFFSQDDYYISHEPVVTPAYKLPVFYLHDVIPFVQVLRFFREDDWSALLPSTVDFRGTDQIQAVRQPFVVPLQSSL